MNDSIAGAIKELYGQEVEPVLTRPEASYGDYATNVALQLARTLGKNPREIAEEIAEKLRKNTDFTEVSVAGPGFINIRVSDEMLLTTAEREPAKLYEGTRYVMEYSCPNAFKELHTGHLYQTFEGDILARLVARSGGEVHRTSFGGDVGLHVAKCLWGMVAELGGIYPEKLVEIDSDAFKRARWISDAYVRGASAYEESDEAKTEIDELNKTIYSFHDSDDKETPLAKLYWQARQWSFDYFDAFYQQLHVDGLHYYPESETAPVGMEVVKEQLASGVLKKSEGAVVFEGDESKHLHTRVFITSKGLPTYETKDIGVIWKERADYNFDKRILITGNDQKEYMRVVFAAADAFCPGIASTMTHLTNGTVKFGDGKKMSSRLGNVTRAIDVLSIVRGKVRELVKDETLVEPVALGAIKYVFAKYRFGGDIAFDVDETVTLNGNSGPYIQYAHARACSIRAKASKEATRPEQLDGGERALVRKLSEYALAVEDATRQLMPHIICTYLYELAQEFNRFYESSRIVGDPREAERLYLVERYIHTLAGGLSLLGIEAPETM